MIEFGDAIIWKKVNWARNGFHDDSITPLIVAFMGICTVYVHCTNCGTSKSILLL